MIPYMVSSDEFQCEKKFQKLAAQLNLENKETKRELREIQRELSKMSLELTETSRKLACTKLQESDLKNKYRLLKRYV